MSMQMKTLKWLIVDKMIKKNSEKIGDVPRNQIHGGTKESQNFQEFYCESPDKTENHLVKSHYFFPSFKCGKRSMYRDC